MLRTTLTAAALAVGAIAVPAQADSTVAIASSHSLRRCFCWLLGGVTKITGTFDKGHQVDR